MPPRLVIDHHHLRSQHRYPPPHRPEQLVVVAARRLPAGRPARRRSRAGKALRHIASPVVPTSRIWDVRPMPAQAEVVGNADQKVLKARRGAGVGLDSESGHVA